MSAPAALPLFRASRSSTLSSLAASRELRFGFLELISPVVCQASPPQSQAPGWRVDAGGGVEGRRDDGRGQRPRRAIEAAMPPSLHNEMVPAVPLWSYAICRILQERGTTPPPRGSANPSPHDPSFRDSKTPTLWENQGFGEPGPGAPQPERGAVLRGNAQPTLNACVVQARQRGTPSPPEPRFFVGHTAKKGPAILIFGCIRRTPQIPKLKLKLKEIPRRLSVPKLESAPPIPHPA
jgi:hypothetical protein